VTCGSAAGVAATGARCNYGFGYFFYPSLLNGSFNDIVINALGCINSFGIAVTDSVCYCTQALNSVTISAANLNK